MIVMVAVNAGALAAAQITARVTHYKRTPLISLVVCIGATLWLAWHSAGMGTLEMQIVLAILGFSFGPVAPVTTVSLQNAVPPHQLGTAVGAMSFGRGLLTTILVAVFGVIVLHILPEHVAPGAGDAARALAAVKDHAALAGAFRTLFIVAALCLVVSLAGLLMMEEVPLQTSRDR